MQMMVLERRISDATMGGLLTQRFIARGDRDDGVDAQARRNICIRSRRRSHRRIHRRSVSVK